MIEPVFIAPLFNHYQPLNAGPLKTEILSLARANGIPADNVYEFDASRQDKRISANVSGLFGTTRISLNDNLLKRCNPREIMAVMGHEMGHYVLDHSAILLTWLGLRLFRRLRVRGLGLSRADAICSAAIGTCEPSTIRPDCRCWWRWPRFFCSSRRPLPTPSSARPSAQADIFGLNAARQPDGFATVTLKLSEYSKLDPSPLEEFIFYDHPSGRSRIADGDALEGRPYRRSRYRRGARVAAMTVRRRPRADRRCGRRNRLPRR